MCLRGCFWHEGSNGLGVGPVWLRLWLPCRKAFDTAARMHDECYDVTAAHKSAVQKLATVQELQGYDYRTGYPDKLEFKTTQS